MSDGAEAGPRLAFPYLNRIGEYAWEGIANTWDGIECAREGIEKQRVSGRTNRYRRLGTKDVFGGSLNLRRHEFEEHAQ